jgi:hypothetical protein
MAAKRKDSCECEIIGVLRSREGLAGQKLSEQIRIVFPTPGRKRLRKYGTDAVRSSEFFGRTYTEQTCLVVLHTEMKL